MEQFKTIGIFRCTEKQYADSFCSKGNMKFNTPESWIELEKRKGKGRGDSTEGVYSVHGILDENNVLLSYKLRNNVYIETINNNAYFRSKDVLNLPCFCLYGLNNTAFSTISIDKKGFQHLNATVSKEYFNDFSNNITKESVKNLPEIDRPVLIMILNPHEFFKRVRNYFINLGAKPEEILISPVIYMDKNRPFICNGVFPNELFLKDKFFSHQNEVRIIINSKDILSKLAENNNIVEIGCLKDITHIESFYYKDMVMELRGNEFLFELSESIITDIKDMPKETLLGLVYQISRGEAPDIDTEEDINKALYILDKELKERFNIDYRNLNFTLRDKHSY